VENAEAEASKEDDQSGRGEADREKELRFCLHQLKAISLKKRLDRIAKEMQGAEQEQDSQKLQKLTEEFQYTSRDLHIP